MYLFGRTEDKAPLSPERVRELTAEARERVSAFSRMPIAQIVDTLDRLSQVWQTGSPYWQRAFEMTRQEVAFSPEMVAHSLNVIPELLKQRNVRARLKADFGSLQKLDHFTRSHSFYGRERAFPLGVLFHVSAGNVFLGAIDSLLMGFLTKNISVIKLSSRNLSFPRLFAESLASIDEQKILSDKFALIHFSGGATALVDEIKKNVDGIIAWGGEEMILSYKKGLPIGIKFIEYGPKISCQVITRAAIEQEGYGVAGKHVATDIALWDQAACASPQNLFIEEGVDGPRLMDAIARALLAFKLPRGHLSDDEYVEILKEKARAQYNHLTSTGILVDGPEFFLHLDPTPGLRPSPLNRTLIIKRFKSWDDLRTQLKPFARYLQSCGTLATPREQEELLVTLGDLGVMRFAPLGQVMQAPIGAPHDGRMTLVELTRLVPEEHDATVVGHVNRAIADVPFYRELRQGRPIETLEEMPLMVGRDFATGDAAGMRRFTRADSQGGYVFSSGGTSGTPKFAFYSHDEFSRVAELLATGFAAQGLTEGMVVANLFVAGNMWSSFLAVDQALAQIGARVLPIGGLTERDATLAYLEQFPPDALVGLPTQLLELARRAQELGKTIPIKTVFYAGEHLSLMARRFMGEVFQTTHFGSAGYASVDAGPIGYQCLHCTGGLHHLFGDQVHLEIIEGEGVVTSLFKHQMPIIRLRTGDLLEWAETTTCPCGTQDPMFKLLGRADSQFNLWGCRLFLEDIERSLLDLNLAGVLFQVVLQQDHAAQEKLTVRIEHSSPAEVAAASFADRLYANSSDLRATHPRSWLEQHLALENLQKGVLPRLPRTGKIRLLVDTRSNS